MGDYLGAAFLVLYYSTRVIFRAMKFVLRKIVRYLRKMRNGIKQFRFVIQYTLSHMLNDIIRRCE